MKKGTNLIRIFTGTEINAALLKEQLEEIEISALIKNDFQSGISVGFVGGTPSAIDLYIQESDYKKAEPIISEFNLINN
jgi:hypothetical protein